MAKETKVLPDLVYLKDAIFNHKKMVVFDTETTGLSNTDQIIQFSGILVNLDDWSTEQELSIYINIGKRLPNVIVELTGITDEILQKQGITPLDAAHQIEQFLLQADVLCGHNVAFDIRKVQYLFDCTDINNVNLSKCNVCDTMKVAKKLLKKGVDCENHKLGTLVSMFQLDEGLSFHNAIDDVIATTRLCRCLYTEEYKQFLGNKNNEELVVNLLDRDRLPYIPVPPVKVEGTIPVKVISLLRWTKSRTMDRLYISLLINGKVGKIYFNMATHEYEEAGSMLIPIIDMYSVHVQICDLIWSNHLCGFEDVINEIKA